MSINLPDFKVETENAIVGRILLSVHKALDKQFPDSVSKDAKFIKTVFSDDDSERTVANWYHNIAPPPQADQAQQPHAQQPLANDHQTNLSMPPSDLSAPPNAKGQEHGKDWLAVAAVAIFIIAVAMVGYIVAFL